MLMSCCHGNHPPFWIITEPAFWIIISPPFWIITNPPFWLITEAPFWIITGRHFEYWSSATLNVVYLLRSFPPWSPTGPKPSRVLPTRLPSGLAPQGLPHGAALWACPRGLPHGAALWACPEGQTPRSWPLRLPRGVSPEAALWGVPPGFPRGMCGVPTGLLCEPDHIGLLYSRVPLERGPSEALRKGSSTVRVTLGRLRGIRFFFRRTTRAECIEVAPPFPTRASLWACPSGPAPLQSSPGESFYSRGLPRRHRGIRFFFRRTTRANPQPSRSPGSRSTIRMRTLGTLVHSLIPSHVVAHRMCNDVKLGELPNAHARRSEPSFVQRKSCCANSLRLRR